MIITDEMLALFLEGKASEEEIDTILDEWNENENGEIRKLLIIARELNEEGTGNTSPPFL